MRPHHPPALGLEQYRFGSDHYFELKLNVEKVESQRITPLQIIKYVTCKATLLLDATRATYVVSIYGAEERNVMYFP